MGVLADGSIVVGDGATDPVAITAFTSSTGLLIHERGGIEANISAITTDQFLGGTSAGVIGIRTAAQVTTSLALTIGTNTQAFGANLDQIAALVPTADNFIVGNGSAWTLETPANVRTSLGLVIGTDVQAEDPVLTDLAALSAVADNEFIVGTGAGVYAHESGTTVRTSLGLGTGDTPEFIKLGVGGTLTDGTFHVITASAGPVAADAAGDDLVIENNTDGGITILTPNNATAAIYFGDPQSATSGGVQYQHSTNTLQLRAKGAVQVTIDSNGVTMPNQPAFLAFNSATDGNVTGNGASTTIDFDTEVYDQNADFAADTFTMPAPGGKCLLTTSVQISGLVSATNIALSIVTSNRSYRTDFSSPPDTLFTVQMSCVADMDASDTATVVAIVSGMAGDTADVLGNATTLLTHFSGCLLA
jgi:hypothetical protein